MLNLHFFTPKQTSTSNTTVNITFITAAFEPQYSPSLTEYLHDVIQLRQL